jgi:hemin uptake protein HemP
MTPPFQPSTPAAAEPVRADPRPHVLASDALLRGRRIVEIVHNGEVYRLQATRLGKLILTK